jgi:hypothetical protein
MWRKDKETTFLRFMVRIGLLRTFECQYLPATEGVNPPNVEFFNAAAHLKAGLVQFSNALGQCGLVTSHRWLQQLVLDSWREQKLVDPRGLVMHVNNNPPLGHPSSSS